MCGVILRMDYFTAILHCRQMEKHLVESLLKVKNQRFLVLQETFREIDFQVCTCRQEVDLTQMDAFWG